MCNATFYGKMLILSGVSDCEIRLPRRLSAVSCEIWGVIILLSISLEPWLLALRSGHYCSINFTWKSAFVITMYKYSCQWSNHTKCQGQVMKNLIITRRRLRERNWIWKVLKLLQTAIVRWFKIFHNWLSVSAQLSVSPYSAYLFFLMPCLFFKLYDVVHKKCNWPSGSRID